MPHKSQKPSVPAPQVTSGRIYAWFTALLADDVPLMDDLLAHGLPIDVLHPLRHTTALMEATRLGRASLVHWLLARGAAPALLCGTPQSTPLHSAIRLKQWEIAVILADTLDSNADIDSYGCTPLHALSMSMHEGACYPVCLRLAATLIEKRCPIDALDHEGVTALHLCALNGVTELAELLLSHGANPNALVPDSWVSPLTIAALEKNNGIANLLLRYGADPHLKTREGMSPASIHPALAEATAG